MSYGIVVVSCKTDYQFCFEIYSPNAELKKHNKVLKEGNFPGISSTIKVTLAADNGGLDHVSGFQSRFKASRKLLCLDRLRNHIFG